MKHEPAPRTPGDAETYMRQEARKYRDVAESEASRGAAPKRTGLTLRIGAYFAEAADALAAMGCSGLADPPAEVDPFA
jgi:hypothetical protein